MSYPNFSRNVIAHTLLHIFPYNDNSFYVPIPKVFWKLVCLEDITSWIELVEWHLTREVVATLRFGRVKNLQKVPWEGKVSKTRFVSVSKLKYFKFVFKLCCQDLWKALWSSKLHERLKIFLWRVDKDY